MSGRFHPIVIHKSEWDRLQIQGGPLVHEPVETRQEYFDQLNELSRKWIDQWPDSAEGIRAKQSAMRKKRHEDNKALTQAFRNMKKKNYREEAVRKAKQTIFNRSSDGQQLISAIMKTKTLEGRELQIKFKKEIQQKEAECEKNKNYGINPLDFDETGRIAQKQDATLECIRINMEMEKKKIEEQAKLKAKEEECDTVDDKMIEEFKAAKAKIKAETKLQEKHEKEEYAAMNKEIAERRKIAEARQDALIDYTKKCQDSLKLKIKAVLKQAIEESRNGERAVKSYKILEELQKAQEKKKYGFIDNAIIEFEKRYDQLS